MGTYNQRTFLFPLALALAVAATGLASGGPSGPVSPKNAQAVYYTFKEGNVGGVAVAWVDKSTGRVCGQEVIGQSRLFIRPHKLKISESGRYLLATSMHAALHNLFLADLAEGTHQFLSVDRIPDDLAAWNDMFVIGAEEQMCYFVDAACGQVVRRWNGRHQLEPDGRRIEYVTATSDGTAWTSWQKDSGGTGSRKGSRVVTIDICTGKTISDLQMPRVLPQLHLADRKERGPNPEIIIPSTRTNTLLLSMDLYGGVALADLDAARDGAWRNLTYHPVSLDNSWGTAFPDRATVVASGSRDFVFVANAGAEGGVSWIDLKERRVAQTLAAPPGLSSPALVAGGRYLVSAVPGKSKSRSFGMLVETREPLEEFYVFEISGMGGTQPRLTMRSHPLPVSAQHAASISKDSNDLVALVSSDAIVVAKAATGKVLDQQPTLGKVSRVTSR